MDQGSWTVISQRMLHTTRNLSMKRQRSLHLEHLMLHDQPLKIIENFRREGNKNSKK